MLHFRWLSTLLLVASPMHAFAQPDVEAGLRAERMLTALGGRPAWSSLVNSVNDSQQNRLQEPTVVRAVITMDFDRPRFRIETTAPGLHLVRVVDGDQHWRLNREGRIEDVPADTLAADRAWYQGHVYRTIHRVAARDPRLSLRSAEPDRLEVLEDGKRIAWFALDARGEPYSFGAHDDDAGTLCGPWDMVVQGIRHPVWVSSRDGSWRARVTALSVNVDLVDSLFSRPESPADVHRQKD
jgi:hypothetical protein